MPRVLVVGGGEMGSAVAHRLVRSGITVFITDREHPWCLRREVCFAMALIDGLKRVEGVVARRATDPVEAEETAGKGGIPVFASDFRELTGALEPDVLVDARMLKTGEGISEGLAPLVIGLGPGFKAGGNVDVVVETKRGHSLGRVMGRGRAEADTHVPGEVMGIAGGRVIRAPCSGSFGKGLAIGTMVEQGDVVGYIDGDIPVKAPTQGLLRGLVSDGLEVREGRKIGDVDPRGSEIDPRTVSDRGRAVAGGVLEAIMHWWVAKSC
jgi:xanthine dehydrogenase accessory factor